MEKCTVPWCINATEKPNSVCSACSGQSRTEQSHTMQALRTKHMQDVIRNILNNTNVYDLEKVLVDRFLQMDTEYQAEIKLLKSQLGSVLSNLGRQNTDD
jgi:hypothetical protein